MYESFVTKSPLHNLRHKVSIKCSLRPKVLTFFFTFYIEIHLIYSLIYIFDLSRSVTATIRMFCCFCEENIRIQNWQHLQPFHSFRSKLRAQNAPLLRTLTSNVPYIKRHITVANTEWNTGFVLHVVIKCRVAA